MTFITCEKCKGEVNIGHYCHGCPNPIQRRAECLKCGWRKTIDRGYLEKIFPRPKMNIF